MKGRTTVVILIIAYNSDFAERGAAAAGAHCLGKASDGDSKRVAENG